MISPIAPVPSVADIELNLLLEAVYRVSGYDLRDFSPAFVKRRVSERMRAENASTISSLQDRLLHDGEALDRFVFGLSSTNGKLFDDAAFFAEIRSRVVPMLRTFPTVRVWVAGCGRGEVAYALAILFREAGIAARTRIYATDMSTTAIVSAKEGRIDAEAPESILSRYRETGGPAKLEEYVSFEGEVPRVRRFVLQNVVFSTHNLVSDGSFNEFHFIVCRDVLTHFNKSLAFRAHQVLFESLIRSGYLALSSSENLSLSPHHRCFQRASDTEQIHRRIR